jgi:hypothetical protein
VSVDISELLSRNFPSNFSNFTSILAPKYHRALLDQPVKDTSLSFLTAGLGQLGLGTSGKHFFLESLLSFLLFFELRVL